MNVRPTALATAVACVMTLGAADARAQSTSVPDRIEVGGGVRWSGGQTFSAADATETTPTGSAFRLFTATTALNSTTSFDVHVGVRVWRRVDAQVSLAYGTPQLRISIANDAESGVPVTATERLQEYSVRGGATWSLGPFRTSRLAPFVAMELGQVRQLHEGETLIQTGTSVEVGGGVRYPLMLRSGRRFKEIGARVDARAVMRPKRVAVDDKQHTVAAIGVSLYTRF